MINRVNVGLNCSNRYVGFKGGSTDTKKALEAFKKLGQAAANLPKETVKAATAPGGPGTVKIEKQVLTILQR